MPQSISAARIRENNRRKIIIKNPSICHHCKCKDLQIAETFCPQCGFPQGGSEKEQLRFLVHYRMKKTDIREGKKLVSYARYILFLAALLNFFSFWGADEVIFMVGCITTLIYFGMAIWSLFKPYAAFLTALIFYVALNLFIGIYNPWFILAGIWLKLLIVGTLFYALHSIKDIEQLRKEIAK